MNASCIGKLSNKKNGANEETLGSRWRSPRVPAR
jgi:hypothetical protein